MKSLSLKLDKKIFEEAERILKDSKKSRNRYINEAVEFYNKYNRKKAIAKQLKKESSLVAEDSMEILKEFEKIEYDA